MKYRTPLVYGVVIVGGIVVVANVLARARKAKSAPASVAGPSPSSLIKKAKKQQEALQHPTMPAGMALPGMGLGKGSGSKASKPTTKPAGKGSGPSYQGGGGYQGDPYGQQQGGYQGDPYGQQQGPMPPPSWVQDDQAAMASQDYERGFADEEQPSDEPKRDDNPIVNLLADVAAIVKTGKRTPAKASTDSEQSSTGEEQAPT
jgi:hypothetical protein